ncbi:MAG: type IX secretion system membrane protein PorP/SprF [Sphingobacteriia bacterium]|nr:type IX secretion system membrane protein PorP/SprF [Sphingobacteriia bacterium]
MLKKKKSRLLFLLFWISLPTIQAQDFPFSQFYANPLYLNPALAGSDYCIRAGINYRNQWPSLPGAFLNYSASVDGFSEFLNGGLGLQVSYDKQGEASVTHFQVSGIYSYRLTLSRDVEARLALQAGYGQRGVNWNELILPSGLSGNQTVMPDFFNGNVNFPDFAAGFLLGYDNRFFLGSAVHHPTQPEIGFFENQQYKLGMKLTFHAGAHFGGNDNYHRSYRSNLEISPNILYQQQDEFRHLNLGSYFTLSPFVAGLWFRHAFNNSDAIILLIGLDHEQYRFGYSYDYTLSSLTNAAGGAHEVSFSYVFPCSKKSKRPKAIKCPTF